jgi:hypothetical protein
VPVPVPVHVHVSVPVSVLMSVPVPVSMHVPVSVIVPVSLHKCFMNLITEKLATATDLLLCLFYPSKCFRLQGLRAVQP